MRTAITAVLAALFMSSTASWAVDEYTGRTIGSACFGCHGAGAESGAAIPPIILGAQPAYIERAMKAFRDGTRPGTIMGRISRGYSDEEIAAVAEYMSTRGGNQP